jgi:hypothetical protein
MATSSLALLAAPRSAEHVFGLSPNARNVSDFFRKPYFGLAEKLSTTLNAKEIYSFREVFPWSRRKTLEKTMLPNGIRRVSSFFSDFQITLARR